MRRALLLLFSFITLMAAAQPKFSIQPLPPTTTLKKITTVGLQQRLVTQEEINRLDSISKLFPTAVLPVFALDYLKSAYVQYYTPDYEEYDAEKGRIYYRIPYEYTQYYTSQKLNSKYEFTFCYDTLKQAWLRQIGNWPYFRRDSIFISNTGIQLQAHNPASYNIDTLRVYNGGKKIFDTEGKYGAWNIPNSRNPQENIYIYTVPEINAVVAKIKVKAKAKRYTKGDDTLGIAKFKKFSIELDTNTVFSTKQENLNLATNAFIALDSTFVGKIKPGKEYYVTLTDGQALGRPEPMHIVYFALPADKKVTYIKPLKYVKLKASTGRKGEGGVEPKE